MTVSMRPPNQMQDLLLLFIDEPHPDQEGCDNVEFDSCDSARCVDLFLMEVIGSLWCRKHRTLDAICELKLDCAHGILVRDQLVIDLAQLDALACGEGVNVFLCGPRVVHSQFLVPKDFRFHDGLMRVPGQPVHQLLLLANKVLKKIFLLLHELAVVLLDHGHGIVCPIKDGGTHLDVLVEKLPQFLKLHFWDTVLVVIEWGLEIAPVWA